MLIVSKEDDRYCSIEESLRSSCEELTAIRAHRQKALNADELMSNIDRWITEVENES